jgi:ArsR family transcriptional regulator
MRKLTGIFKLLSDETRLRVLFLLYQEKLCVCELSGIMESPQPKISKSLAKLKDLNLVSDERRDRFVFYHLNKENEFLMEILKLIHDEIDLYPALQGDQARLSRKEEYSKHS